jgi:hypothetical protein
VCPSIPNPPVYISSRLGLLALVSAALRWSSSALSLGPGAYMAGPYPKYLTKSWGFVP